jgi:hypothetical protein
VKKDVGGCVKERKVGSRKTCFAWLISLGKAAVLCRYNNNAVHAYMHFQVLLCQFLHLTVGDVMYVDDGGKIRRALVYTMRSVC